jgi:hypothetical protein
MKCKVMTISLALVLIAGFAASIGSAKDGDSKGMPIKASFTLAYINMDNPNALFNGGIAQILCGPLTLPTFVTANGAGYSSKLGALSFSLQKTMGLEPGTTAPTHGKMQGCATFKAPNGVDTLSAKYEGDANTGVGILTFYNGTGRFKGATGTATFTGVFVGTGTGTLFGVAYKQGMAFYLVEGRVQFAKEYEEDE